MIESCVFGFDSAPLTEEEAAGDSVGVVGVEELSSVGFDGRGLLVESLGVEFVLATQASERDAFDLSTLVAGERDGAVVVRDELLDLGDGECLRWVQSSLQPVADEVLVDCRLDGCAARSGVARTPCGVPDGVLLIASVVEIGWAPVAK